METDDLPPPLLLNRPLIDDYRPNECEKWAVKGFEMSRILIAAIGLVFGYSKYYRVFSFMIVFALSGLTGVESIVIGKASAHSKGWPINSPYQIQSALNNLTMLVVIVILMCIGASDGSIATVLVSTLTFIFLFALNHLYSVVSQGQKVVHIHICRFVGACVLMAASVPPICIWKPFK